MTSSRGNNISDEGAMVLAEALKGNTTVTELDLCGVLLCLDIYICFYVVYNTGQIARIAKQIRPAISRRVSL